LVRFGDKNQDNKLLQDAVNSPVRVAGFNTKLEPISFFYPQLMQDLSGTFDDLA
jgi:hypothetical protein